MWFDNVNLVIFCLFRIGAMRVTASIAAVDTQDNGLKNRKTGGRMNSFMTAAFRALMIGTVVGLISGCHVGKKPVVASLADVRSELMIVTGDSNTPLDWAGLIEEVGHADVIVLGEEHDDANGHAVQLAIVEDVLDERQGGVVAFEMLERDEQILVDDHVDGILDDAAFAKETGSTSWAGEGSWEAWYQPVLKAALQRHAKLIAANAPRRYVRLARLKGWDALEELPDTRADFVAVPPATIEGTYRDRFYEIMSPSEHGGDDDRDLSYIDSFYQAQLVWDATMADSVAQAVQDFGSPVILLIGRFHSDFEGGTVQEIRRHLPNHVVKTVSLETLRSEPLDAGRDVKQADVIVYTRSGPR